MPGVSWILFSHGFSLVLLAFQTFGVLSKVDTQSYYDR
jgi:hypothetical protein